MVRAQVAVKVKVAVKVEVAVKVQVVELHAKANKIAHAQLVMNECEFRCGFRKPRSAEAKPSADTVCEDSSAQFDNRMVCIHNKASENLLWSRIDNALPSTNQL